MKDTLMILMLFCTAYFSAQQTEYFNVDGSGRTAIIFPQSPYSSLLRLFLSFMAMAEMPEWQHDA